ncbi:MAG: hypothetical protein EZS28_031370, partial [Streblomastix strix]
MNFLQQLDEGFADENEDDDYSFSYIPSVEKKNTNIRSGPSPSKF